MSFSSDYPVFYVTVDVVCLTVRDGVFSVLLAERGEGEQKGRWALPGGFVHPDEDLETAARRELEEETGVRAPALLEQLASYGDPGRDPRGRVVSVAHLAVAPDLGDATGGSDATAAAWVSVETALRKRLAFDHNLILRDGVARARAKLEWSPVAASFCPPEFTVADLRGVYEAVWGARLDPANFHRKATGARGFLVPLGRTAGGGRGRPAQLYRVGSATRIHPPLTISD